VDRLRAEACSELSLQEYVAAEAADHHDPLQHEKRLVSKTPTTRNWEQTNMWLAVLLCQHFLDLPVGQGKNLVGDGSQRSCDAAAVAWFEGQQSAKDP
jgi:hypothetical protein